MFSSALQPIIFCIQPLRPCSVFGGTSISLEAGSSKTKTKVTISDSSQYLNHLGLHLWPCVSPAQL